MEKKNELAVIHFDSQEAWESWLAEHHETSPGLWLKLAKKGSNVPSLSYQEALDSALCYGWIDSQKASYDEIFWLQRFTPRRAGSKWSRINREKVTELIAQERMKPAGLKEVEQAREDGRWERAYASQRTITVPEDFQAALEQNPDAAAFFATINSANRFAILHRIHDAKRAATRAQRIEKYIAMLKEGKTIY